MKTDIPTSEPDSRLPGSVIVLSLAEAVVSCLALRDLLRLQASYPGVVAPADAKELQAGLARCLHSALADSTFDDLRARSCGLNLTDPTDDDELSLLFIVLVLRVPGTAPAEPHRELAPDAMKKAVAACQDRIGSSLKDLASELLEIKLYDCRVPSGDPRFSDRRRSIQLLRSYWSICRSVVLHQIDACVGYHPHPLQRILANLRARIDAHLELMGDGEGSAEVKAAIDALLDTLLGGSPDDIAVADEWARQHVQTVETFLEEARLTAGSKVFPRTHEEETFIAFAEAEVGRYHRHVDDAWARMQAVALARALKEVDSTIATSARTPRAEEQVRAAQPGADVSVADARKDAPVEVPSHDGPEQPCLGLTNAAIQVVRAYQAWEARRAKRRGMPASPTVDDLVAEASLARATVIRARGVLIQERLLEQIPGAREGTLRLTQRGLQVQLPSGASTVQSSVQ